MSIDGTLTCPDCGKERYKRYDPYKYPDRIVKCLSCKMKGNKAGCRKEHKPYRGRGGYTMVWIGKDDFFFPMAHEAPSGNYGVIAEHRLMVAKALGRCLQSWEIVHHKNGIKDDNRYPDNLELTGTNSEHIIAHSKGYRDGYRKGFMDGRLKQIQELKLEIRRLQNA